MGPKDPRRWTVGTGQPYGSTSRNERISSGKLKVVVTTFYLITAHRAKEYRMPKHFLRDAWFWVLILTILAITVPL